MELTFQKTNFDCMRQILWQTHNEEQTQELKLPDAFPDIGRVLCTWGQVMIRSKQWNTGGMTASGGVMAWVLYAPEDGSEPRSVETWIPFQMRWDFPETERDGTIRLHCLLRSADSRSVSARKLMVRVCVSVLGEALEPTSVEVCTPKEVPEDIQLLQKSYPVRLPKEAGEKVFQLDEELPLPASEAEKVMYYTIDPEVHDRKVLADKVVFRGSARVHLLYRTTDNVLKAWDGEIPFSQYTELSREYGPDATASVIPLVTGVELEQTEQGGMRLKGNLSGQYVIYATDMLEMVEDAYSPRRDITVQTSALSIPALLDSCQQTMHMDQSLQTDIGKIMDVSFYTEHPTTVKDGANVQMTVPGQFQLLYQDAEGRLQCALQRVENQLELACGDNTGVNSSVKISGHPDAALSTDGASMQCDVFVNATVSMQQGLNMVHGLHLGELKEQDPARPSLILKRMGERTLWDLAKECGSTIETIRQANRLTDDPQPEQMLIIPVI